jgi:hypothetical protein
VSLIEEPVKLTAAPSDDLQNVGVEGGEHARDRPDRHVVDLTTLEARDHPLADAGSLGDVDLTPAKTVAEGPGDPAKTEVAHVTILGKGAHLRLHRRSPARTIQSSGDCCRAIHGSGRSRRLRPVRGLMAARSEWAVGSATPATL